jgi:hypothetical protein
MIENESVDQPSIHYIKTGIYIQNSEEKRGGGRREGEGERNLP